MEKCWINLVHEHFGRITHETETAIISKQWPDGAISATSQMDLSDNVRLSTLYEMQDPSENLFRVWDVRGDMIYEGIGGVKELEQFLATFDFQQHYVHLAHQEMDRLRVEVDKATSLMFEIMSSKTKLS